MIGFLLALAVAAVDPSRAMPVRLAPVSCQGLTDAALRAALRVELRDRLVVEAPPAPADFALVSVACAGDRVDLLIVRQESGAPVRRQVPTADVAPDARPRAVAIAIAELLRVDAARPEPAAPPPATVPTTPPPPKTIFALSGTPLVLGGYFSGPKHYWTWGVQLRLAWGRAIEPVPGRRWGWGLAVGLEDDMPGAADRMSAAGTAAALVRWQGAVLTGELGAGARFGRAWDYAEGASSPSANFFGPFGSLALEGHFQLHNFSRLAVESGFDSGPLGGGWARLVLGGGLVF